MKTIQKQASGTFYADHSKWCGPILHRSASGKEGLISAVIHNGSGFSFFSCSWNNYFKSRK